jgi:6-phospho-beta-glucosidase
MVTVEVAGMSAEKIGAALAGAEVVLIQARFGGYAGRHFDETFPIKFGLCGDEGLGVGGLSAAWRVWPAMRTLLGLIRDNCGAAKILMLSSPVSILVRAASVIFPELCVLGVCELPWTTLLQICELLRVAPDAISFDYAGINHVGWFYGIHLGSLDLLLEYCNVLGHQQGFPTAERIQKSSGVPLKYLRLHYDAAEVLKEQQKQKQSRAQVLQDLSSLAFASYAAGDSNAVLDTLRRRPAPWYEHCVGPLIRTLAGERIGTPFFLSARGSEFDNEWSETDIFEIPCRYEGGSWRRIKPAGPVPLHIAETLRSFVEYERIAVAAVIGRDSSLLEIAIRTHPWTIDHSHSVVGHIQQEITGQTSAIFGA